MKEYTVEIVNTKKQLSNIINNYKKTYKKYNNLNVTTITIPNNFIEIIKLLNILKYYKIFIYKILYHIDTKTIIITHNQIKNYLIDDNQDNPILLDYTSSD